MTRSQISAGQLLQDWRRRRRRSQLDLALDAGVSQRHLSFLETGRSLPSREMILNLADHLAVPPRERNALLVAAGYAPVFRERSLGDPSLSAARKAVDAILTGHSPHPALALDRHWNVISANEAAGCLMAGADADLLQPLINALRVSLHPRGLGSRLENYCQWRAHVMHRLAQQVDISADPALMALLEEITGYPTPITARLHKAEGDPLAGIAVPFKLRTPDGILSFISTTTVFGSAVDILLSELTIETFFPADEETAQAMRALLDSGSAKPAVAV